MPSTSSARRVLRGNQADYRGDDRHDAARYFTLASVKSSSRSMQVRARDRAVRPPGWQNGAPPNKRHSYCHGRYGVPV